MQESAQATSAGSAAEPAAAAVDTAAGAEKVEPGAVELWVESLLERYLPFYADHPWLQSLTLVVLSVMLASLVSIFLKRFVSRLLAKTATTYDDHILEALTPPIYTWMIAFGFRAAIARLGLSDAATARFAHLLWTLGIFVSLIAAIQVASLVMRAIAANPDRVSIIGSTTVPLFDNLTKIGLVLVATYLVISVWGGDLSGLLAAGGIAGLAIGFAARDTLANLFAGIFIFADSPYKIGDFINLDSGERGMVTDIGLRSTRLLTRDDVQVTIPNAVMGAAKIVNESGGPHVKYRIRVKIGVAYGSDLEQVEKLLLEIAEDHPLVCPDPEPRVRFRQFGASSLDLELLCWINEPVLRGKALHHLNLAVYNELNRAGIEIPFSQHDIYIKEMPRERSGAQVGAGEQASD